MNASHRMRQMLLTLFLAVVTATASVQAQPARDEYKPQVGQEGKDVIWVPTPQKLVEKMLGRQKSRLRIT
jgi:hypothetical protein